MNAVEVKGLSYTYPDGTMALDSIDLSVDEGDTVGIVGSNGAGKSTLLLNLNGTLANENVKLFGREIDKGKIALVFQNPDDQLFCPTVFDDVAFGPLNMGLDSEKVKQRVSRALSMVEMAGYENRSPQHLSFGEKKKISLATVLSMDPVVLLLDEPTSNLDPRGRREFISLLKSLELTKIIATHDLGLVSELCNRIVVLDRGKKVLEGRTEEIIESREFRKILGIL